ncbi:MAG TPA: 50S ribosomal protein L24e [Candidatus Nanoarchaeia archaeon]|nr:50S ribosomal protein L24e [Candidatus Nanoarchaeia archaeon]
MAKCTFCGEQIEKGTGKMFVYISGKIANFCSNKCEKNLLKLKRKPLETRWTQAYRQEHKKISQEVNKEAGKL